MSKKPRSVPDTQSVSFLPYHGEHGYKADDCCKSTDNGVLNSIQANLFLPKIKKYILHTSIHIKDIIQVLLRRITENLKGIIDG